MAGRAALLQLWIASSAASVFSGEGSKYSLAPAAFDLLQLPRPARRGSRAPGCSARRRSGGSGKPGSYRLAAVNSGRRKHWGWGYEAQQPTLGRRGLGPALSERLGIELARSSSPWRSRTATSLRRASRSRRSWLRSASDDLHERASHALGKSYVDVVRGFRGQFEHPPDFVARPRSEQDVERLLEWCSGANVAAIPYGGGTSVVGGVTPGCRPRARTARSRSTSALSTACSSSTRSPARPASARGDWACARGGARRARANPAPLPPVLRAGDARRLDRDARCGPLRHRLDAHRGLRGVRARDHPGGRVGVAAAARLGRRPQPRPDAGRLGGDPRCDHERMGAGAAAARARASAGVALPGLHARRRVRAGDLAVGAEPLQLPPARRRRGPADDGGRRQPRAARARLRVDRSPRRRRAGSRAGDLRRARRVRRASRGEGAGATPSARGAARSSALPTRATCSWRWA